IASSAAVPIRTAIVRPTITPVWRAVPATLRIGFLVLRHGEGHRHSHSSALSRRYVCLATELHGKAPDQGEAEAARVGSERAPPAGAIALDGELGGARLVGRLDTDLGRGHVVELAAERAAHRLGDDQADGNGDVGTDRHGGGGVWEGRLG